MQPKIVEKDRMLLLGLSFFGDPFEFSGDWSEEIVHFPRWRQKSSRIFAWRASSTKGLAGISV